MNSYCLPHTTSGFCIQIVSRVLQIILICVPILLEITMNLYPSICQIEFSFHKYDHDHQPLTGQIIILLGTLYKYYQIIFACIIVEHTFSLI